MSHAGDALVSFPGEHSSLRQHDLDGTDVRRAAILGGHLLRRDADIAHLGVGDEPPADDLGDIDRSRDRPSAGFDDDLPRTSVEIGDDREHVIHRRFLPDVDDARVNRESATTGDEAESGRAVLILSGRALGSNAGLENVLRPRFLGEAGRAMARDRDSGFHSAAGLIRYFDQEDEKALKVPPWIVVALCVGLSALVLYVTYTWPLQSTSRNCFDPGPVSDEVPPRRPVGDDAARAFLRLASALDRRSRERDGTRLSPWNLDPVRLAPLATWAEIEEALDRLERLPLQEPRA